MVHCAQESMLGIFSLQKMLSTNKRMRGGITLSLYVKHCSRENSTALRTHSCHSSCRSSPKRKFTV